jgi:secondary thiamine-phosphate synthase enzyme
MKYELKEISIRAKQEFEMVNITQQVKDTVRDCGITNGIVYVITEHTTTGITVNEALPCVEKDIMQTLDRLFPENYPYNHNHYLPSYGTIGGNTPGHLKSLLTGNHCVFPIVEGKVKLGSAADIYFCEYDGIKNRKYMIYVMGE